MFWKTYPFLHTADGRHPKQPPGLGCIKPCKQRDKLPTSTGARFLPSTVRQISEPSTVSPLKA